MCLTMGWGFTDDPLAPIADQSHPDCQWLIRLAGTCELKPGCRHFTDYLVRPIRAPRDPLPDIRKRSLILILMATQQRDDAPSRSRELKQELGGHAFSIHHQVIQMHQISRLFIAPQQLRGPNRQMLVASMSNCQQWMALLVMQHH